MRYDYYIVMCYWETLDFLEEKEKGTYRDAGEYEWYLKTWPHSHFIINAGIKE